MKNKFLLFIILSLFIITNMKAQDIYHEPDTSYTDVTTRVGFSVRKELPRKFQITWEEELRTKSNVSEIDRIHSSLGVSYSGIEYLKLGLGYVFQSIWHDGKKKTNYEKYWDFRHRIEADVTGNYKYMRWKFSLRERFLTTFRTDDPNKLEKANPKMALRSRLYAEYSIFGKPLRPYASFEISNTLNAPAYASGNYIDGLRSEVGLKWRLNMRNSLEFFYRFDVNYNRDIDIDYKKDKVTIKGIYITKQRDFNNIIGVFYTFDWLE